jgi:hypothetical protein
MDPPGGALILASVFTLGSDHRNNSHGIKHQAAVLLFCVVFYFYRSDLYSFQWIRSLDACYLNWVYVIFLKVLLLRFSVHWNWFFCTFSVKFLSWGNSFWELKKISGTNGPVVRHTFFTPDYWCNSGFVSLYHLC